MATKIIHKKSTTSGASPATGDLDQAELAINLVNRKIFTKDNGNAIVTLSGPYVSTSAPSNPAEGDLWFDSTNNVLKAHDGSSFVSVGDYGDSDARAAISVTDAGGDGSAAYNSSTGVITYTGPSAAEARAHVSVTDSGGDGSLTYSNSTGVFTYTGPNATEVRAHLSAGTGVTYSGGAFSIGQAVATSDNVTFADATLSGSLKGPATFTIDPATVGDNTGTVVIAGNLTVNGSTTSVNSNEVNIGDSIIKLNADETGTPSQNGGIEIERGTAANKSFVWNESSDAWDLGDETLQSVIIDGGTY